MDSSRLNEILHHPAIWPDISNNAERFHVEPKPDWDVHEFPIGVVIFHPFRDGVKVHPNFLPEGRGKAAFDAIRECVAVYPLVYAEIDKGLRHVNWAARYMGFELIEQGERNLYRWRNK